MIRLGDKVRFVNENMQGVVTRIDGKTAGVTIEDDFEIPVLVSEIVKIADEKKSEDEVKVGPKHKYVKVHSGIHIAFDRISETLHELWLHNSEADLAVFAYYHKQNDGFILKKTGELALETAISLGRFDLEQFNQWPEMAFQVMLVNSPSSKFPAQLVKTVRFSAKEFHAGFKQCYFLGRQAYMFRLDPEFRNADLQKLKEKDFSEPAPVEPPDLSKKPQDVVDLHAASLHSEPASLSAQEIMDLQMNAFTRSLEMAHVHKMKRIIFIHGVGNHFLKNKIKNYLDRQKQLVKEYRDADAIKYGGGATEVHFN